MRKTHLLFLIFLIIALSGCSLKAAKKDVKREAPEILIAQDCGMDKLQCCKTEPVCLYSQECCIDPNNPMKNYCSDKCTCGAKNEFCCADNQCNAGLVCRNGNCLECGQENKSCCSDNQCDKGLECNNGKCITCGVEGNICCSGETCLNQNNNDKTRTGCFAGICLQCGSVGIPCPGEIKCIVGHINNNGTCYACGEANQPCCQEGSGRSYDCDPKIFLSCYQGFCLE